MRDYSQPDACFTNTPFAVRLRFLLKKIHP